MERQPRPMLPICPAVAGAGARAPASEATAVPVLVLTAEASYHANYDHCTVKYLRQAGVQPTWIKLADAGIHGNGHMMMLEKNNLDIARLMAQWLQRL